MKYKNLLLDKFQEDSIEAIEKNQQIENKNEIILAIIDRLKTEFEEELIAMNLIDGKIVDSFIKLL